ncbi:hypothetical protein VY86_10395 [Photorhabdus thracensis]|uniref:Uncharacterized protein n=1 Tax=Photorhabdus thracensis TaxID=230089 RepID=A0A0F7LNR5_9GAMM|nr:hypothetical protein VY86_10395 [Photorhabdus thracensis]
MKKARKSLKALKIIKETKVVINTINISVTLSGFKPKKIKYRKTRENLIISLMYLSAMLLPTYFTFT